MRTSFITGITGQDGYYLSRFLLSRGYRVYGVSRGLKNNYINDENLIVKKCDILDFNSINSLLDDIKPDEIYHLASSNSVDMSFKNPINSFMVDCIAAINIFEYVKNHNKSIRIFNASSSEIFGIVESKVCTENTQLNPISPYGMAKEQVFRMARFYREHEGMFICNGILFNHDSPKRSEDHVFKKITTSIKRIIDGKQNDITLGNIDVEKDYGYAEDYVEAMYLSLQNDTPDDYIIATGTTHTVRDMCEKAFSYAGLNYIDYVHSNTLHNRPVETSLVGDISHTKNKLNWIPKTEFGNFVKMMTFNDIKNGDENDKNRSR